MTSQRKWRPPRIGGARSLRRLLIAASGLSLAPVVCAATPALQLWPEVATARREVVIPDAARVSISESILSKNGVGIYRLDCRGTADTGEASTGVVELDCRLVPLYGVSPHSADLLLEDPLAQDQTRGRGYFRVDQLVGDCAAYPDYGRRRPFRLRGMELTLELRQVVHSEGRIRSYVLQIDVKPQSDAFSTIAEPSRYEAPGPAPSADGYACSDIVGRDSAVQPGIGLVGRFALGPPYPQIRPVRRIVELPVAERTFSTASRPLSARALAVEVPIEDDTGAVAYRFQCANDLTGKAPLIGPRGISCGLFVAEKPVDLLGATRDPVSLMRRSDFLLEQLSGPCAAYPDWGSTRVFRLRGMAVAVDLREVEFADADGPAQLFRGGVKRLVMEVDVAADPLARTAFVAPSMFLDWRELGTAENCATPFKAALLQGGR